MGRSATKAVGNVWYEARMEAAEWNEALHSRAGAAEAVGMSEDAIKNTELGIEKCMPVDKAVLLADLYNAPELLNYYCLKECPIGRIRSLSDQVVSIDRVTVKLLKRLRIDQLDEIKAKLLDIAEDGMVTEDEIPELEEVMDYLSQLSKTISELKIIGRKVIRRGGDRGKRT